MWIALAAFRTFLCIECFPALINWANERQVRKQAQVN